MIKIKNKQRAILFTISLIYLFIFTQSFIGDSIDIECCVCKKTIITVTEAEYHHGPWEDIPCLHRQCLVKVQDILAPNSGMTVGQWFEVRGFNPRHEDISGLSWSELINREYEMPEVLKK